ncbi:hypothetical protein [Arthrobacter sp. AD-310]
MNAGFQQRQIHDEGHFSRKDRQLVRTASEEVSRMALLTNDKVQPSQHYRAWINRVGYVNACMAACGVMASALIMFDVTDAPLAAFKLAVSLLVPGWMITRRLHSLDPAARLAWTAAASCSLYVVLAVLMSRSGLWFARPTAVVVLLASSTALMLAPGAFRGTSMMAESLPRPGERRRRPDRNGSSKRPQLFAWAILVLAASLWIIGVNTVRPGPLDDFGLLPQLPIVWYLALAISVAVSVWLIVARNPFPPALMSSALGLLTVILYATPALLASAPRFPWTYKHIAVTNLITGTGQVDPSIDIYNRWPGFFSVSAFLGEAMGYRNALDYAAWAETGFALVDAVLVLAIARTLSNRPRVYWTATLVFTLCNWVNQNYYAPQSLGYTLHLSMCLLVLSFLRGIPNQRAQKVENWIRDWRKGKLYRSQKPYDLDEKWDRDNYPVQAPLIVACLVLQAAIVVSHQLTPYMAILGLFPLFVAGYFKPRWLGPVLLAVPLVYFVPNLAYIKGKYGLFSGFDLFANTGYRPPPSHSVMVGTWELTGHTLANFAVILTILVGVLAVAGFFRRLLQGHIRSTIVVAWMAFSPALGLLVQSYGGEARFRIFLFSLPWLAVGVAWLFWSGPIRTRRAVAGACTALIAMAMMFTTVHYQPEADYRVAKGDVTASQWLDENLSPGDLVLKTKYFFPLLIGANYPRYLKWGTVTVLTKYFEESESNVTMKTLRDYTEKLRNEEDAYVVISDDQLRHAIREGTREAYLLPRLERVLKSDLGVELVFNNETVRIYRFAASG